MLFSILIFYQVCGQKLVKLEEGKPEKMDIKEGEFSYFYAVLSAEKYADVALQPLYGDTDLYGNLTSIENVTDFPFPNTNSYQYSSISAIILESIHLKEADLHKFGSALKISVHCLSKECGFVIYYDQGMYPLLADNRPMQGIAERFGYSYFRYVRNQNESITVIVTLTGNANPDLFVSKGKIPTVSEFMWHASSLGGESLTISEGGLGIYYIGVYCEHQCTFTVTVLTHTEEFLPLYPGLPQYMTAKENTRTLFYFPIYEKRWVEIKVSVLSGDLILLANTQNPEVEEMIEKVPNVDAYTWISNGNNNADTFIEINITDKNLCSDCNIIVSVISKTNSRFIITEVNKSYLEILNNGVPVHGYVDFSEMDSFMFMLDTRSSIKIVLTVFSGDADLYVATSLPVSDKLYDWKSNTQNSLETVTISIDDRDWKMGMYYMAVKGWIQSFYSILVYCEDSGITIDLGLVRRYELDKPLRFILNQSPSIEYTCTLTCLKESSNPSIYINFNSETFPTPSKHDKSYKSDVFNPVYTTFSFNFNSDGYSSSLISIYSDSDIANNLISFVCVAPYTIMKIGQHDYTYYELKTTMAEFELLVNTAHDVRLTLFYCIDPVSIEISTDRSYPYSPNIFSTFFDNKAEFYIKNSQNQFFIKVVGNIGDSFEIFTETITSDNFSMQPGGDILINKKNKEYKVSWSKALVNGNLIINEIDYYLFIGKYLKTTILNYCSLNKMAVKKELKIFYAGNENQATIKSSSDSYLTVAAVFKRHRFEAQGFAIYDIVKLEDSCKDCQDTTEYSFPWIYFILITSFIILSVVLFKLKSRQRYRRNPQGYELSNY